VRYLCLAAIFLVLPLTAAAQDERDHRRSESRQSDQRQTDQRQHAQRQSERRHDDAKTGAQPPSNPGVPPWERKQTPWWERQGPPSWERSTKVTQPQNPPLPSWVNQSTPSNSRPSFNGRGSHRRRYQPSVVYVLPPYRFFPAALPASTGFYVTPPAPDEHVVPTNEAPLGALHLDVEPRELLQIFVDGSYVGTPNDVDDQLELAPGTRRIELRARGYRTLTFNAEIIDGREITYRGALEREMPAPEARQDAAPVVIKPSPPANPTTIYMIPGCYLGNVAPKASDLRAGCDMSRLKKTTP
jgi:hypothetical protein